MNDDIESDVKKLRELKLPDWWRRWTDYPHRGWSLEEAREINRFLVAVAIRLPSILEGARQCLICQGRFPDEPEYFAAEGGVLCVHCAERDSLRLDKERLDWLEKQGWPVSEQLNDIFFEADSVREAIDKAARLAGPTASTEPGTSAVSQTKSETGRSGGDGNGST